MQLRARQKLGKYRIEGRIATGGFATVYRAQDTIEGVQVALKVPHDRISRDGGLLEEFKKEARIAASLDHANILPIKNAMFIDDVFVIASPLGECSLLDRFRKRLHPRVGLGFVEQMLEAVACAHENRIIHLDIKPENFILFNQGERLRLSDFGISKVAYRTNIKASGTGTLGYVAPEQALGKPSYRSDVFSLGLVAYRMFSGVLPEWPYDWPLEGLERIRAVFTPEFVGFLEKSIQVDQRHRYADATRMLAAFQKVRPKALRVDVKLKRRRTGRTGQHWKTVRFKQFRREHGKALGTKHECKKCGGPMSEAMRHCPWCGVKVKRYDGPTSFPLHCGRCGRGMKKDWRFCPWCYGAGYEPDGREYSDVRYTAKCSSPRCTRRDLMPFMSYCPWCRTKVRRGWPVPDSREKCDHCGWGVLGEFWQFCPWCGKHPKKTKKKTR